MTAGVKIVDPKTGMSATVSEYGQLITGPVDYSVTAQQKLDVNNQAFNFIKPEANRQIIITGIIMTANKNVGATDATVTLYTSETEDGVTAVGNILQLEMQRNSNIVLTGVNVKIDSGLFINAVTDDNDVYVTLFYYRVPV